MTPHRRLRLLAVHLDGWFRIVGVTAPSKSRRVDGARHDDHVAQARVEGDAPGGEDRPSTDLPQFHAECSTVQRSVLRHFAAVAITEPLKDGPGGRTVGAGIDRSL